MKIFLFIILIIVLLLVICLIRTLLMKPSSAKDAQVDLSADDISIEHGKRLAQMLQVETISSEGYFDLAKFEKLHEVFHKLFPLVFSQCEVVDLEGNLIIKYKGKTSEQPFALMAHQDVVEATGTWDYDPFSGEIVDNVIYGRGTADTKGSLYCIFESIEELLKEGYVPARDVYIISSVTEEIGGDGAVKINQYLKEHNIHLSLLLDEGGMVVQDPIAGLKGVYGVVGVLEKGQGNLKIIAKGRGGHSSTPPANQPIVRLAKFVTHVENRHPFKPVLNDTVQEMFKRFAPNMDFTNKFLLGNLWLFKPLVTRLLPKLSPISGAMIKTTCAFTMQEGSSGMNVIPQEAWINANLRYSPDQDMQVSNQLMEDIAKKYDLEVQVVDGNPSCPIVDYKSKEFHLIEEVMADIYPGVVVSPYAMTGATDSRFFVDVADNLLRFAPLYITIDQNAGIHGLNENIYIASLKYGVNFYKEFIKKYENM